MGIRPFDDIDEDDAPPGWGGRREGAGPPLTKLTTLDITDIGVEVDGPATYYADVSIVACSCGRVGWEAYRVTVRGQWRDEPDEDGDHCPVLASVAMPGSEIKHARGCPLA